MSVRTLMDKEGNDNTLTFFGKTIVRSRSLLISLLVPFSPDVVFVQYKVYHEKKYFLETELTTSE